MSRMLIAIALVVAACGGKSEETPPVASGSEAVSGSAKAAGSAAGSATSSPAGSAAGSGGSAAGSAGSAGSAGTGSAVAKAEPEVPTAEDFEAEATARITEKNLETEVKAIEKEIGDN